MQPAFDTAALTYDRDFTQTVIGQWLRERVWGYLATHFQAGMRVLEIGCGTGEDAVWLARRGVRVVATDVSEGMLAATRRKADEAGVGDQIETRLFNLNRLVSLEERFDGAYSNFGAINCTSDWVGLAQFLSEHVQVGGYVGLGVMPPFCLWETVWHGTHLHWRTAVRRWRGQTTARLADGSELTVYYPTIKQLTRAFMPQFARIEVRGVGVFLPPSDVFGVIEKRPRLLKRLLQWESRWAGVYGLRGWGDHYWIGFKRHNND